MFEFKQQFQYERNWRICCRQTCKVIADSRGDAFNAGLKSSNFFVAASHMSEGRIYPGR
jgi:hypothetical protein